MRTRPASPRRLTPILLLPAPQVAQGINAVDQWSTAPQAAEVFRCLHPRTNPNSPLRRNKTPGCVVGVQNGHVTGAVRPTMVLEYRISRLRACPAVTRPRLTGGNKNVPAITLPAQFHVTGASRRWAHNLLGSPRTPEDQQQDGGNGSYSKTCRRAARFGKAHGRTSAAAATGPIGLRSNRWHYSDGTGPVHQ